MKQEERRQGILLEPDIPQQSCGIFVSCTEEEGYDDSNVQTPVKELV